MAAMAGGWLVALLLGVFTLATQIKKSRIDESALVLAKWKEMVDSHERDLTAMRDELRRERADNSVLRGELRAAEAEIRTLKDQVAALSRSLAQLGQSTAIVLDSSLHDTAGLEQTPATQAAVKRQKEK